MRLKFLNDVLKYPVYAGNMEPLTVWCVLSISDSELCLTHYMKGNIFIIFKCLKEGLEVHLSLREVYFMLTTIQAAY